MQTRGANGVLRKPLRNDLDHVSDNPPGLPLRALNYLRSSTQSQSGSVRIARKPVGQYPKAAVTTRTDHSSEPSAPHLLGPRPMHPRLRSIDSATLENRPERRDDDTRRWSENPSKPPKLPTRPSWGAEHNPPCPPRRNVSIHKGLETDGQSFSHEYGDLHEAQVNNLREHSEEAGSLTLIRRYDNLQWNVGKISRISGTTRLGDFENTHHGLPSDKIQGASIAISTPGYAKFTGRKVLNDSASQSGVAKSQDWPSRDDERVCFTRQLQAANIMKTLDHRQKSESGDPTLSKHGFSSKFKIHRLSREATSDEMTEENFSPTSPTHQTVDSKGYVFQSPWNGICEFHTGVAGRSLKCKHTVSPLGAVSQTQGRSAPVSELRFNLPSSKSLGVSSRKPKFPQGYSEGSKRSSVLSRRSQQQLSSSDAVSEQSYEDDASSDDRLDLSLGQEHAGGGFGGKQAKLGKLIIESEGLKMLDLVVAANVGIWWRVYEKYV